MRGRRVYVTLKNIFTYSVKLPYIISAIYGIVMLLYLGMYLLPIMLIFTVSSSIALVVDCKIERIYGKKNISLGMYFF